MDNISNNRNRRILRIDDNEAIHEDFRVILTSSTTGNSILDKTETVLFGREINTNEPDNFQVDSAFQVQDALPSTLLELRFC